MGQNIKAIFFDLDGTLVEAQEWHYLALNDALNEVAGQSFIINRREHVSRFDGLSTRQKLNIFSIEKGLDLSQHQKIFDKKQEFTIKYIEENCKENIELSNTIKDLKNYGYKLAICTNSIDKTMNLMLDKLKINSYFELKLSNNHVVNPKPHPEIYQKAAEYFNINPDQCLVVEDNEKGFVSALSAGCYLLKVRTPKDITFKKLQKKIKELGG